MRTVSSLRETALACCSKGRLFPCTTCPHAGPRGLGIPHQPFAKAGQSPSPWCGTAGVFHLFLCRTARRSVPRVLFLLWEGCRGPPLRTSLETRMGRDEGNYGLPNARGAAAPSRRIGSSRASLSTGSGSNLDMPSCVARAGHGSCCTYPLAAIYSSKDSSSDDHSSRFSRCGCA